MHSLLDEAEKEWREDVKRDFPLRSDTVVVHDIKPNGRDWTFSTDLRKINTNIANDEGLQRKFETIVTKYWDGNPEELARDTLRYLLHHELYHPIEAPFSVSGDPNDSKEIHQAMRRGLIKAEPELTPLDQVVKVHASQNGVKDFILDNRFAVDNQRQGYVKEDIIPVWDVLEMHDESGKTNFYTATRFLYGVLYGPESTHEFFGEKTGKKGVEVAERALSAVVKKPARLPKYKNLVDRAKSMFSGDSEEAQEHVQEYITELREVFSGKDRYNGIERFMEVLGPYVEKDMPQGRKDMQEQGSGTSPQSILQDLLDDMTPEEQAEFVEGLAGEEGSESEQFSDGEANSVTDYEKSEQELNNLDVFSMHEYYKRNHPRVRIVGGNRVGESVVVGKREYWDLKNSKVLTRDELSKINLGRIDTLQRRTRLPWLIDLGNGTFRLNEYELKEKDIKDVVYVDQEIDVPDLTEFYLDSSGSMYGNAGNFGFNDGSRWDMLSHVLYGFTDAINQGGKAVGKHPKLRIHNFADKQKSSEEIPVEEFWRGDTDALRVLFKPENGYSVEDINIVPYTDGSKRAYVTVTDGNLVISGRTEREAQKMRQLAQYPNNDVVLFEIGGTYDLGQAVKNDPKIVYHQVHDKDKMLQAGLEVLLSK
ncbi:MAG: hypothetical protein CMH62_01355 [Nanoarchaeota archaeon]|nr:hypothetical protein [Nanoarchaeota archaeon]